MHRATKCACECRHLLRLMETPSVAGWWHFNPPSYMRRRWRGDKEKRSPYTHATQKLITFDWQTNRYVEETDIKDTSIENSSYTVSRSIDLMISYYFKRLSDARWHILSHQFLRRPPSYSSGVSIRKKKFVSYQSQHMQIVWLDEEIRKHGNIWTVNKLGRCLREQLFNWPSRRSSHGKESLPFSFYFLFTVARSGGKYDMSGSLRLLLSDLSSARAPDLKKSGMKVTSRGGGECVCDLFLAIE